MHFFTVTRAEALPQAAALVGSLYRYGKVESVTVVVAAEMVGASRIKGASVKSASDFGVERMALLKSSCAFHGRWLGISLAPLVASRILSDHPDRTPLMFVDSHTTAVADLGLIEASLVTGESLTLATELDVTEHRTQTHAYPGVFAIRQGKAGNASLSVWSDSVERYLSDICDVSHDGRFLMGQTPSGIGSSVSLLEHAHVAHIEPADQRHTSYGETATLGPLEKQLPLLMDWDEFSPSEPGQTMIGNIRASQGLDLVSLLRDYRTDIKRLEASDITGAPPERFADGTRITKELGALASQAMGRGICSDPFRSREDCASLFTWLNEPSSSDAAPTDTGLRLSRYQHYLWKNNRQLHETYPELQGQSLEGLLGWLFVHGPTQLGMPTILLPRKPRSISSELGEVQRLRDSITKAREPDKSHDKIIDRRDESSLRGVNLVGFLTSELGLGEAARLLVSGLDAAKVPVAPIQTQLLPPSRQDAPYRFMDPQDAPFDINLICINGDGFPRFAEEVGNDFFDGRYTIANWWWETDEIPESWDAAFPWIDEVWVASDLVAEAVRQRSPVPVKKIKLPVVLPARPLPDRTELGLPHGFNFYFSFDYHSTVARKNPIGVIEAFKQAFKPSDGAYLTIKSINAEKRPWDHAEVLNAAEDRPDIYFIDAYVSADERDGLMAACDCYVSLHRSEGLGLTPAEALWFGKPVIATGYGGVLEFLSDENSYLVVSKETYVGPNADPYPSSGRWREPDIEQAAFLMRRVYENPSEARRKGVQGARDIRAGHSLAAAGASLRNRFAEILSELPAQTISPVNALPPLDDHVVSGRLASEPAPRGGLFARTVRKATRKVQAQDRERQLGTDRELLDLIHRVDERLRSTTHELERNQQAEKAESLGLFRAIETQTQEIFAQLDEVLHLLAEHRSLPYVAGDFSFEDWHEGELGRVQGFVGNIDSEGSIAGMADAFRGSEDHVRSLQKVYVPLLSESGPVLEVGSGRGEFLDLLGGAGVAAEGVDMDPRMVERARSKGHKVECADGLDYLESCGDSRLGAIFSAQVIEHLPFERLERFLSLSLSRLRPGGLFVAETVNPHCVNALKAFWVDPTHQHPLFPETMLQLARSAGFGSAYVFHPNASGDVNRDRYNAPSYALVARAAD